MPTKGTDSHLISSLGRLHPQFHPAIYPDRFDSIEVLMTEFEGAMKSDLAPWVSKLDSFEYMKGHLESVVLGAFDATSQAIQAMFDDLRNHFR